LFGSFKKHIFIKNFLYNVGHFLVLSNSVKIDFEVILTFYFINEKFIQTRMMISEVSERVLKIL